MMEGWKEVKFGDVVQFPPKVRLKKGKSYPFIPMENLDSGIKYVKPLMEKEITGGGAKFEEGDTLFSRITPCLQNGKIAQAKDLGNKPGFGSTEYFVFRGKDDVTNTDFVYYLSKSQWFKGNAENSMVGSSGRQRADAGFVRNLKIHLPPLPTQRKIASILSAYDDLIENNLKRIQLLEEQAQLTYEEWFVRFKFPGHEEVEFVDGLPEGWEEKELNEIASVNAKSINKSFSGDIFYIDIKSVSPNNIDFKTKYNIKDAPGRAKRIVKHGDIIWSCVRPNRKSHAIIWEPKKNWIASTGFCVISPNEVPTSYLYQFLTTETFVGYLTNLAGGAAYPAVKAEHFKKAKVIIPTKELVLKYDSYFSKSINIIWSLKEQNQLLKEARDILLPRLMSGMIDVETLLGETAQKSTAPNQSKVRKLNPDTTIEKRKAIAAYIILESEVEEQFGKVKFEKLLHLSEFHAVCGNYERNYKKFAAGPLDTKF